MVHILHVTWNFTAWNFWLLLYYGNIVWLYRINCGVSKILNQQQCILFFMFYTIFERQSIFTPNCNTVALPFSVNWYLRSPRKIKILKMGDGYLRYRNLYTPFDLRCKITKNRYVLGIFLLALFSIWCGKYVPLKKNMKLKRNQYIVFTIVCEYNASHGKC